MKLWPKSPKDVPMGIPPALWALLWSGLLVQILWLGILVVVSLVVIWRHLG